METTMWIPRRFAASIAFRSAVSSASETVAPPVHCVVGRIVSKPASRAMSIFAAATAGPPHLAVSSAAPTSIVEPPAYADGAKSSAKSAASRPLLMLPLFDRFSNRGRVAAIRLGGGEGESVDVEAV